jgi:magnesium-transporting ATPase (P-type)
MELDGATGFGLVLGFVVALLLGSVMLRTAVRIANRSIGPLKAKRADSFPDWDWDGDLEDEEPRHPQKAIPEPGLGKGMMIASTLGVVTVFIGIALAVFADTVAEDLFEGDEDTQIALLAMFTLPLAFVSSTLLLAVMLPTTFWRAALVSFVTHVFALILFAVVVSAVVVLLLLRL